MTFAQVVEMAVSSNSFFLAELPWLHSDDQAIRTTKVESVKIVELLILEADVFVVMCCV